MTNIIDLVERRKAIRAAFKPRLLNPRTDKLPETITEELAERFIGVYESLRGWISLNKKRRIFSIEVMRTGREMAT